LSKATPLKEMANMGLQLLSMENSGPSHRHAVALQNNSYRQPNQVTISLLRIRRWTCTSVLMSLAVPYNLGQVIALSALLIVVTMSITQAHHQLKNGIVAALTVDQWSDSGQYNSSRGHNSSYNVKYCGLHTSRAAW
jgi:hypothetical protein